MLGIRLEERRKFLKLTRVELAEKLHVGTNTVFRWEKDERNPTDEMKKKIANVLHTSVAYLMDETDDPFFKTNLDKEKEHVVVMEQQGTHLKPVTLEDIARTREGMRNLQLLDEHDLNAAEEMAKAMLETIQRERAIRTAQQDGVAKSACPQGI